MNIPEGATHVLSGLYYKVDKEKVMVEGLDGWEKSAFEQDFDVFLHRAQRIENSNKEPYRMKDCARCGGMFDTQMHDEGCPCMTRFDGLDAANADQGMPSGAGRPIATMVMEDLIKRTEKGIETYGEALRANNGRDALVDAYQEALDLAMYLRQAIEERSN